MIERVSVVVPVFNSEKNLVNLLDRLLTVLSSNTHEFEILLINDGSYDKSWNIICQLAKKYTSVKGINLMRNFGQHNAVLCGIRIAKYEVIVTIDDDLQNPPEEIPKLLNELNNRYDVVYGVPEKQQHGFWRNISSRIIKASLQNTIGIENIKNISAFRAFRTNLREAFANYNDSFVSIDVLLTWGTTRFSSVKVLHDKRQTGTSNYTFYKLITHTFNMITNFSILPLQIASLLGFLFTLFGMAVFIYVLINYLIRGGVVPGFTFIAAAISLFAGVQLFALGIIGEYLARIHFRSMARPYAVIRDKVGFKDSEED